MREIKIEIDEETLRRFQELPDVKDSHPGWQPTPEQDALLLRFWPIKTHRSVAKALGVSYNTALRRYRELAGEKNETD